MHECGKGEKEKEDTGMRRERRGESKKDRMSRAARRLKLASANGGTKEKRTSRYGRKKRNVPSSRTRQRESERRERGTK